MRFSNKEIYMDLLDLLAPQVLGLPLDLTQTHPLDLRLVLRQVRVQGQSRIVVLIVVQIDQDVHGLNDLALARPIPGQEARQHAQDPDDLALTHPAPVQKASLDQTRLHRPRRESDPVKDNVK